MRFKTVPPAPPENVPAAEALRTVRDALPLVPRSQDDCCGRLVDRVAWIEERDVATEWIGFLRALGLAERSDAGYSRVRDDVDTDALATRFRANVVGVGATIDALEAQEEPQTAGEVFEAIESTVPEWERRRSDTWHEEWNDHTERLLAWATALEIATAVDDGYRLSASGG
ncbi:hypothetical protein L593_12150 [Salinarchaeum sp. Harcht-Bsk1]|uniref:hypothetical protein n=1 Tax=Salinarchaeum sp. Harcht-Bsk1 TaxID=1333523 RepID=UPI000342480D|nr:hypothetical protein [Salinarchaeum sp. Harcht-Bsk1]AGN02373.1 hypothetical protein L593_12150 [Salinarchaeum sp. Harcht-Bsk1]